MTLATKLEATERIRPHTERRIQEALDHTSREMRRQIRPDWRGGLRYALGAVALLAFGAVVQEVDRQRKEIARIRSDYEAMVAFTKVLIEETNCGKQAYFEAHARAEDETGEADETITDWTSEDEVPIPFVPTED